MNNIKRSAFLAILLALPAIISSCINGSASTSFPSSVQIGMEVAYIDSIYKIGGDSIKVDKVRFIIGDSYFITSNTDSVFTTNQTGMVTFDAGTPNPGGIAGRPMPAATYQAFELNIPKAPTDNSSIDDDFVVDGKRYTIIVEGSFNGDGFTYKSERVIQPSFTLMPPLQVPETNERYTYILSTDLRDWFLNSQTETLYDPRVSDNSTAINDNIEGAFSFGQL